MSVLAPVCTLISVFPVSDIWRATLYLRMRKLSFLFGLGLLLAGCNHNSRDLKIPAVVTVTKTANDQQFPATRVFINIPQGFQLVREAVEFQKDSNTYIKVQEQPGEDFYKWKPEVIKMYEEDTSGKLKEFYKKEFKFGGYDALLLYGTYVKPDQEQIGLVFGNHEFIVMGYGGLRVGDNVGRDEILKSLLSMYVDTTVKADVTGLAGFTLDVSKSEFTYEGNLSQQAYLYTVGGRSDRGNNAFQDRITVSVLPAMTNEAKMLYAEKLLERYKSRMDVSDVKEQQISLNGNYAYEISFKSVYQGRNSIAYQLVTGNDNKTIMLVGSVYNRQEELMAQVKQVAQTLQVK